MPDMPTARTPIFAESAPSPKGPYTHAVAAAGLLFCSAQIGVDPATQVLADGRREQASQALRNLAEVCRAAGGDLLDAARLTLYLADLDDLPEVNEACIAFFGDAPPARSTLQAARLVGGASVGIDAIVVLP